MRFKSSAQRKAVMRQYNPKKHSRKRFMRTVFDTETTGFSNKDRLIEFASVSVDSKGDMYAYRTLIQPPVPISRYATAVHGYVNDDLSNAPVMAKVEPDICQIISSSDEMIAHNANYDVRMLKNEGVYVPPEKVRDTMRMAKDYKPLTDSYPQSRYNLDEMCKGLGVRVPSSERHSGMGDVIGTLKCYNIMNS